MADEIKAPDEIEEVGAPDEATEMADALADALSGGDEAPAVEADDEAPEIEATDDAPEPEPETFDAPKSWNADDREKWAAIPDEVKAVIARRETERDEGVNKTLDGLKPLRDTVSQWDGYLSQIGATPEQAFNSLMGAEQILRNGTPAQKRQALQTLATDYGIEFASGGQTAETEADPFAEVVEQVTGPLRAELDQVKQSLNSREQAAQAEANSKAQAEINAFATAKTDAGTLANPHFEAVQDDMVALASTYNARGQAIPSLQELYDAAAWGNPSVREKLIAEQTASASLQAAADRKAKATKARRAGASITGAPGIGDSRVKPQTLQETIEEAYSGGL